MPNNPPPLFLSHEFRDPEPQVPAPGPADEEPGSVYLGETTQIPYFEPIGPVEEEIVWAGRPVKVAFRLLDIWEERELTREVEDIPGSAKIIVERQLRIARSLVRVGDQVVGFSPDPVADADEREEWASRFPGPLLYELSKAYERAAAQPLVELGRMRADPNSAP